MRHIPFSPFRKRLYEALRIFPFLINNNRLITLHTLNFKYG